MKRNYFVFIINQMNKHGLSRRQFTETDAKHFKSGALTIITDKDYTSYGKLKKRIPWQNLFTDTEEFFKMRISSQVIFKKFVGRFGSTCLKNLFI